MTLDLPPHLAEEYQRIMGGRLDSDGAIAMDWPAGTADEVKASKARAKLVKKELRLLRTTTRQEQKLARQEHVADRQGVQAGLVVSLFGRKVAAADRIAQRERSKAEQADAMQPYDNLINLIDHSVLKLDGLVLQLSAKRFPKPSKTAATKPTKGDSVARERPASETPAQLSEAPPRQAPQSQPSQFLFHTGPASATGVLIEWKPMSDGEVEGRGFNFYGPQSIWLRGDELPESLSTAGCRITNVVGVTHYRGLTRPDLAVGQRVQLRPEPDNQYDPNAIVVWSYDRSDVRELLFDGIPALGVPASSSAPAVDGIHSEVRGDEWFDQAEARVVAARAVDEHERRARSAPHVGDRRPIARDDEIDRSVRQSMRLPPCVSRIASDV